MRRGHFDCDVIVDYLTVLPILFAQSRRNERYKIVQQYLAISLLKKAIDKALAITIAT